MLYMVTFTINIPPIFACLPYMDPMGNNVWIGEYCTWRLIFFPPLVYLAGKHLEVNEHDEL